MVLYQIKIQVGKDCKIYHSDVFVSLSNAEKHFVQTKIRIAKKYNAYHFDTITDSNLFTYVYIAEIKPIDEIF